MEHRENSVQLIVNSEQCVMNMATWINSADKRTIIWLKGLSLTVKKK